MPLKKEANIHIFESTFNSFVRLLDVSRAGPGPRTLSSSRLSATSSAAASSTIPRASAATTLTSAARRPAARRAPTSSRARSTRRSTRPAGWGSSSPSLRWGDLFHFSFLGSRTNNGVVSVVSTSTKVPISFVPTFSLLRSSTLRDSAPKSGKWAKLREKSEAQKSGVICETSSLFKGEFLSN